MASSSPQLISSRRFCNPRATTRPVVKRASGEAIAFHRSLPAYLPSELMELPEIAERLGVRALWVKLETSRWDLPSFKALGAWWAGYLALSDRLGHRPRQWRTFEELAQAFAPLRPLTLVTASDGNHGRAVARFARLLHLDCRVFLPAHVERARVEDIGSEGACIETCGSYEAAVQAAERSRSEAGCLLLADTTSKDEDEVTAWIAEGYGSIIVEAKGQFAELEAPLPDVVVIPIGCGTLASGIVRQCRQEEDDWRPMLLGVEPLRAACALASLSVGRSVEVPPPHDSIMTTLNASRLSAPAYPLLESSLSAVVAIQDEWVRAAVREMAACGVEAGPVGGAALAALLDLHAQRDQLSAQMLTATHSILLLCTEGMVDPEGHRRIVGEQKN